ncbi:MAG: hypothetical protein A2654_01700 [Candidatus Nealsonbacteria bacterium RIFCSPHIGHO2_01_FULL_43_31]|uniref:Uncharacterized protein n=2 Tax=Candidatus Nealsoniibacteriota TaxID=1817911 RepID=A0A1G2E8Z5_9BACT|nr:MAG: hypothetical protein A2654_01700 [Candidatus Nealsonbacteria bacterium RIFCSPHIGHO2_01_FULL_43_31]OGZ22314.1 MAG: hypothetical protein A3D46_02820 [Candidatus Nealsonbacteria bacterium RIFCSPHIGHO2_02_FULL_43_13]OGZ24461.1 MAG: hypothetical protein A2922_02200 [Candidatus Nealsonbacteria bacterium RIFCSPLOWO2_01_FULL_43_36]
MSFHKEAALLKQPFRLTIRQKSAIMLNYHDKIFKQIYSDGKSPDTPGSFRHAGTANIDWRIVQKILFQTK